MNANQEKRSIMIVKDDYSYPNERAAITSIREKIEEFKQKHPDEKWELLAVDAEEKFIRCKVDAYSPIGECKDVYSYKGFAIMERTQ